MELQTIANQYLKPERIMEYLDILKKRDSGDYEKSATFFKYVMVTRYKNKIEKPAFTVNIQGQNIFN